VRLDSSPEISNEDVDKKNPPDTLTGSCDYCAAQLVVQYLSFVLLSRMRSPGEYSEAPLVDPRDSPTVPLLSFMRSPGLYSEAPWPVLRLPDWLCISCPGDLLDAPPPVLPQRDGAALIRDQMSLRPFQRSGAVIRFDIAPLALAKVHKCTEACEFWFKKELTGGHLQLELLNPTVRTRKHRGCVMLHRRRSVPYSFEDQIAAEKAHLEEQVADLPYGPERDALLRKNRQLETASHMNEWLNSLGLRPPE
jgi:hypothetical protein